MRIRVSFVLALLLFSGLAAPAAAAPYNSPVFEEVPFSFATDEFPNPCLGEGVSDYYEFEGVLLIHEMTNPSSKYHYNDVAYIAGTTASGFESPSKMVGPIVENLSDNAYTHTETGLYQFRNDAGDKLRLQLKIHMTVVSDDVKVDLFGLDFACLGN